MEDNPIEIRSFIILGILSIVWGSSFILIKKALIAFEPFDLACMRLGIAAISFTPVLIYHRKKIPWKRWKTFLAVGITGSGVPAFMYFLAQTNINSMISGLLNSLVPIWTLLIGVFIFKLQINFYKVLGVILGLLGAVALMVFSENSGSNSDLWYGLFVVVGTLCYGVSGNLVKHYFQNVESVIISATSFFLVGIPPLILLIYNGRLAQISFTPSEVYSLGAIFILSIVGTVLATILFYKLIQETNAVFGSSVAYLMPIVATLWGVFDGESIGWIIVFSMVLILSGVYLIRK